MLYIIEKIKPVNIFFNLECKKEIYDTHNILTLLIDKFNEINKDKNKLNETNEKVQQKITMDETEIQENTKLLDNKMREMEGVIEMLMCIDLDTLTEANNMEHGDFVANLLLIETCLDKYNDLYNTICINKSALNNQTAKDSENSANSLFQLQTQYIKTAMLFCVGIKEEQNVESFEKLYLIENTAQPKQIGTKEHIEGLLIHNHDLSGIFTKDDLLSDNSVLQRIEIEDKNIDCTMIDYYWHKIADPLNLINVYINNIKSYKNNDAKKKEIQDIYEEYNKKLRPIMQEIQETIKEKKNQISQQIEHQKKTKEQNEEELTKLEKKEQCCNQNIETIEKELANEIAKYKQAGKKLQRETLKELEKKNIFTSDKTFNNNVKSNYLKKKQDYFREKLKEEASFKKIFKNYTLGYGDELTELYNNHYKNYFKQHKKIPSEDKDRLLLNTITEFLQTLQSDDQQEIKEITYTTEEKQIKQQLVDKLEVELKKQCEINNKAYEEFSKQIEPCKTGKGEKSKDADKTSNSGVWLVFFVIVVLFVWWRYRKNDNKSKDQLSKNQLSKDQREEIAKSNTTIEAAAAA